MPAVVVRTARIHSGGEEKKCNKQCPSHCQLRLRRLFAAMFDTVRHAIEGEVETAIWRMPGAGSSISLPDRFHDQASLLPLLSARKF
jgi:hypothetical protein